MSAQRTRKSQWRRAAEKEVADLRERLAKRTSPIARARLQARIDQIETALAERTWR